MTVVSLDFETASEAEIKTVGLSRYARDPSTRVLMCAYRLNGVQGFWDVSSGRPFPPAVRAALAGPAAEKTAFNASFERMITKHVLGIDTPYEGWRCTMALAYTQSFVGGLGEVSEQMGMPLDLQKASYGKKLIKMFSMPQKVTAKQPLRWFDHTTHPREWAEFCAYCVQDEVTEDAMRQRLQRYPLAEREWELYELDQRINDTGLPIDRRFVLNAIKMSDRRKAELSVQMKRLTGLDNPNSTEQLLAWLKPRGYPFGDLQKDTVSKVLSEDEQTPVLDDLARRVLRLRQNAARMSVKKYDAVMKGLDDDDVLRHCFQFGGASRTNRWAGRRFQPTNLARTPYQLGDDTWLTAATDAIRDDNAEMLELIIGEPMTALVGCVRSAVRAPGA
jgi:DNA polymerase